MYHILKLLIPILFLCPIFYSFASEDDSVMHPVSAEVIVENETIQAGKPFWVALKIKIDDHWHVYWKNPGDTGFPVAVEWILPEGMTAGPLKWPVPQRMTFDSSIAFGYENELILLTQITPKASITSQPNISAKITWLVCSDETCMPGNSHVSTVLWAADREPRLSEKSKEDFERARGRLPQKASGIKAFTHNNNIELFLDKTYFDYGAIEKIAFFPEETHFINSHLEPKIEQVNGHTLLKLKKETLAHAQKKQDPTALKGILVVHYRDASQQVTSFDLEIPIGSHLLASHPNHNYSEVAIADAVILPKKENGFDSTVTSSGITNAPIMEGDSLEQQSFALALVFAFIGGMILNLMPCVLPVISIKILSFIHMAGKSRSLTLKHGALFSLGVVFSFWVIAGLLILLQMYGHAVGWGFHLQHPIFVVILSTVFMLLSLNLFGVFSAGNALSSWAGEVQGVSEKGLVSSFMSGVLATAVATPCTGPFLGASIGLAATLSPIWSLMIFTSLGVGMAFPYIVLSAFPKLLKVMPKPGNWMVTFKELMGFFMLATALWLLWVFAAQTSSQAVIVLLIGFLGLSIAAWVYGKWTAPTNKKFTKIMGLMVALTICLGSGYIIVKASQLTEDGVRTTESAGIVAEGWEPFSPERIVALQKQGIPVIVDFTAKWCLICQTNHMVLSSDALEGKFQELGVVKMLADWTKSDPVITAELKKYGRNSVPLYLLYGPDPSQPPVILPQVLTVDNVLTSLETITDIRHVAIQ